MNCNNASLFNRKRKRPARCDPRRPESAVFSADFNDGIMTSLLSEVVLNRVSLKIGNRDQLSTRTNTLRPHGWHNYSTHFLR